MLDIHYNDNYNRFSPGEDFPANVKKQAEYGEKQDSQKLDIQLEGKCDDLEERGRVKTTSCTSSTKFNLLYCCLLNILGITVIAFLLIKLFKCRDLSGAFEFNQCELDNLTHSPTMLTDVPTGLTAYPTSQTLNPTLSPTQSPTFSIQLMNQTVACNNSAICETHFVASVAPPLDGKYYVDTIFQLRGVCAGSNSCITDFQVGTIAIPLNGQFHALGGSSYTQDSLLNALISARNLGVTVVQCNVSMKMNQSGMVSVANGTEVFVDVSISSSKFSLFKQPKEQLLNNNSDLLPETSSVLSVNG